MSDLLPSTCHISRAAPNRTSGERDATQPQARDRTEHSLPSATRTLNSGEAEQACITCSDTAVPVTVLTLFGDGFAEVVTERGTEEVSVALVRAKVGDTVLVHAGEAIAVLRGAS